MRPPPAGRPGASGRFVVRDAPPPLHSSGSAVRPCRAGWVGWRPRWPRGPAGRTPQVRWSYLALFSDFQNPTGTHCRRSCIFLGVQF